MTGKIILYKDFLAHLIEADLKQIDVQWVLGAIICIHIKWHVIQLQIEHTFNVTGICQNIVLKCYPSFLN